MYESTNTEIVGYTLSLLDEIRFRCLTMRVSTIFSSVSALTRVLIQGLFLSYLFQLAVSLLCDFISACGCSLGPFQLFVPL